MSRHQTKQGIPFRAEPNDLKSIAEDVAEISDIQQKLLDRHADVCVADRVDFLGINDPAVPTDDHRGFMSVLHATGESAGASIPFVGDWGEYNPPEDTKKTTPHLISKNLSSTLTISSNRSDSRTLPNAHTENCKSITYTFT